MSNLRGARGARAAGGGAAGRLEDPHEWISFEDPEFERTWVFDVTFLLSAWSCIYGNGCEGVLSDPAADLVQGCCSYGAELSGDEDAARVEAAAANLTDDQWQFRKQGRARGVIKGPGADGVAATRLVDGACVFLNRPGFPGGPGCALHRAALDRGERPMDTKPEVCWQLPLRLDEQEADDGHLTTTITQWHRRHWGEGGSDFHWWCTEATEAFTGAEPVYRSLRDELVAMVGERVYELLAAYLDERSSVRSVALPHPVVRTNGRPDATSKRP